MIRTLLVANLSGAFFAVVMHCVAGGLRRDLGDWPALIGFAAGALVGAVAGAAERVVQAIDAQTDRLASTNGSWHRSARPPAGHQPATGIQTGMPSRAP